MALLGIVFLGLFIFEASITIVSNDRFVKPKSIILASLLSAVVIGIMYLLYRINANSSLWASIYVVTAIVVLHLIAVFVGDDDDVIENAPSKFIAVMQYTIDALGVFFFFYGFINSVAYPLFLSTPLGITFKIYLYVFITLIFIVTYFFIAEQVWRKKEKAKTFKISLLVLLLFTFLPALVMIYIAISNFRGV